MKRVVFITGTDTGVGKTFLAVRLTRRLLDLNVNVRTVKPFCSGGREDAEALADALGGGVPVDEINPWHFSAPITPLLAARQQRQNVGLDQAVDFLRKAKDRCDCLVIEGAGGLLSPLGEGFDSLELIKALRAVVVVVAANRIGVLNHVLLTLKALPKQATLQAAVVLTRQANPDISAAGNTKLLRELLGAERVFELPFVATATPHLGKVETKTLLQLARHLGAV